MKPKLIVLAFVCGIVLALNATPAWCVPEARKSTVNDSLQSVRNLHAIRKGDKVTLTWSQPRDIRDGTSSQPRHVSTAKICRDVSSSPQVSNSAPGHSTTTCAHAMREVDVDKSPGPQVETEKADTTV